VGLFGGATRDRIVVKSYGRASFLGLLSPLLAFFMAERGMRGWEDSTRRAMEKDAVDMARRGYRIVSTEEAAMPVFGMASYKVTYELTDQP
jgi:hypothetical protein